MIKDKKAFTLAEVMITIGIIGIVAAITIPLLTNNANSRKFSSQYKKSLATLAQASLMSQARYDVDYSLISEDSANETCRTVALSKGNNSMCALFNNAFAAKSYRGVYGSVGGVLPGTTYSVRTFSDGFSPANYLIYTLSDGAMVGFNPSAKGCSLNPGTLLDKTIITTTLANCMGFIDVNGISLPNREVSCDKKSDTALKPNIACKVEKANGDVFPIVFHNGTVEPASNAAHTVLNSGGKILTEEERIAKRRQFDKWEVLNNGNGMTWDAAVEACHGAENLPTEEDLYALAKSIYPTCNAKYCTGFNADNVPQKLKDAGFGSKWLYLWSGVEDGSSSARARYFYAGNSNAYSYAHSDSGGLVVCVGDLE